MKLLKRCAACREYKELGDFNANSRRRDGKNCYCKRCSRERHKEWRDRNKERLLSERAEWRTTHADYIHQRSAADRARLRKDVLAHYGGKCACCGEREPRFLTMDHVGNNGASHRRETGKRGHGMWRWIRANGYPSEFQILCFNCNCAKGAYGKCPHAEA